MSAPRSSRWVAKLCRSECGVVRRSSPASFRYFSSIRPTLRVVSRRPYLLTNTGVSGDGVLSRFCRMPGPVAARAANAPGAGGVGTDGRQPLLAAFAPHAEYRGVEVQVAVVEAHDFADSQSGRVHRLEDRPIAQAHRRVGRRGIEEPAQVFRREEMRQRPPLARIPQRLGRIRFGPAFALAKTEETAQRGQMPGDARLRVARLVQCRHVAAEIEHRHVARRGKPPAVGFGQIVGQRTEVFTVALDRVRRSVALDGQELEKTSDGGVHGRKGLELGD